MQNLDWNKCFQQVRGVELHFPFVRGLAVGLYWGCLRPTTQGAALSRRLGHAWQGSCWGGCAGPGGAAATAREPGPSSDQVNTDVHVRPPECRRLAPKFNPLPYPLAAEGEASESALARPLPEARLPWNHEPRKCVRLLAPSTRPFPRVGNEKISGNPEQAIFSARRAHS